MPTINDLATNFGEVSISSTATASGSTAHPQSPWPTATTGSTESDDTSDSDDEKKPSHPNKYPVEIEYHDNKFCSYQRQATRLVNEY